MQNNPGPLCFLRPCSQPVSNTLRHRERVGDEVVVSAEQALKVREVLREGSVLQVRNLRRVRRAKDDLVRLGAVVLHSGKDVVHLVLLANVGRHQPALPRHEAQDRGALRVRAAVHHEHGHVGGGVLAQLEPLGLHVAGRGEGGAGVLPLDPALAQRVADLQARERER